MKRGSSIAPLSEAEKPVDLESFLPMLDEVPARGTGIHNKR